MEFYKAIDLLVLSQLIVFIVVVTKQDKISRANKTFVIIYMIAIALCILDRIQYFYRDYLNALDFPHLYHSADPLRYVFLPAVYLYIKSISRSGFTLKWIQWIHFVPSFIVLSYVLFNYTFLPINEKYLALRGNENIYSPSFKKPIFIWLLSLQKIYLIFSLFEIIKYHRKLKQYLSNLRWFNTLPLYIIVGGFIITFISRIFMLEAFDINLSVDFNWAVYSIIIIAVGFKQKDFFNSPPIDFYQLKFEKITNTHVTSIKQYMQNHKPFLNPELSLEILAAELNMSQRKLSDIINQEMNTNFFNFINQYRIEEAKQMLINPDMTQKTILEILYEVGFNSKSAFNRVFKDFTDTTPSAFRKRNFAQSR